MKKSTILKTLFGMIILFVSGQDLTVIAQEQFVKERLFNLNFRVARQISGKTEFATPDQVPILLPGDKLHVGTANNGAGLTNRFSTIVTIFLPISIYDRQSTDTDLIQVSSRKILTQPCQVTEQRCDKDETDRQEKCFGNCTFTVPNYNSIPIVFFLSGQDNWAQAIFRTDSLTRLRNFTSQEREQLLDFGEESISYTTTPKKLQFLIDANQILKTPAAKNGKVLQSLYQTAFTRLKLDPNGTCSGQMEVANAVIDDNKSQNKKNIVRDATKLQSNKEAINFNRQMFNQLQCLVGSQQFDVQRIINDPQTRQLLNWRNVNIQLSQFAVSQLKLKFPQLEGYLQLVNVVMNIFLPLIENWINNTPINITSAIANLNENDGTYEVRAIRQKSTQSTRPPGDFRNAVFFVPFKGFDRDTDPILSDDFISNVQPTPLSSCVTQGENGFSLPSEIIGTTNASDFKLLINRPDSSSSPLQEITIPKQNIKSSVIANLSPAIWGNLNSWQQAEAKIQFRYNFQNHTTLAVPVSFSRQQTLDITPDTINTFRKGANGTIRLKASSNAGCVEKVVFVDSSNKEHDILKKAEDEETGFIQPVENSITEMNVSFNTAALETIALGQGTLKIFQSGQPVINRPLTLRPELKATNLVYYPEDSFAVMNFETNVTPQMMKTIKSVKINGASFLFNSDKQRINSINQAITAESNVQIITNDNEEIYINPQIIIKERPRERFKTDACADDADDVEILVAAQWTDQNGRYRAFEPCQVIPADIQPKSISIQLKSPNAEYVFTEHQPYKLFAYLENYESKTGSGQCTNATIVQIPGTDITVEDPQLDLVNVIIRLNNTSVTQKLTCPGWRIRLRLIEQETGFESVDLTLKQPFSILPVNLRLDCVSEGETPCRLIADGGTLNRVRKVSIKGNTNDSDFVNVTNTLTLPKPLGENSVWIQLNNGSKLMLKDSAIILPPVTLIQTKKRAAKYRPLK